MVCFQMTQILSFPRKIRFTNHICINFVHNSRNFQAIVSLPGNVVVVLDVVSYNICYKKVQNGVKLTYYFNIIQLIQAIVSLPGNVVVVLDVVYYNICYKKVQNGVKLTYYFHILQLIPINCNSLFSFNMIKE